MNLSDTSAVVLLRRLWAGRSLIGVCLGTGVLLATVYVLRQPDMFEATAHVRIREFSQARLSGNLPGENSARPQALVLTTRNALLAARVVREVVPVLMPGADPDDENALAAVRGRVKYRHGNNYEFGVSMIDGEPQRAADAVNALITAFLKSERDKRSRVVENQRLFYHGQFKDASEEVTRREDALQAFRKAHTDSLPENRDRLKTSLGGVTTHISMLSAMISGARRRADFLREQVLLTPPSAPLPGTPGAGPEATEPREIGSLRAGVADVKKRLREARSKLDKVRMKYTDEMLEVRLGLRDVKELETELKAAEAALQAAQARYSAARARALEVKNGEEPVQQAETLVERTIRLMKQLRDESLSHIDQLTEERNTLLPEKKKIEDALTQIPFVEQAMQPLLTKLEEAKEARSQAQAKLLSANEVVAFMNENSIEDVTPFERQRDATAPAAPIGPNRMRVVFLAAMAGAGLGAGLTMLREFLKGSTFRHPREIVQLLPQAMVVSIPLLGDGGSSFAPKRGRIVLQAAAWTYVLACLVVAGLAFAAFSGWPDAPQWLRALAGK